MKPLIYFFEQLFPSISSVFTEQAADMCGKFFRDSKGTGKPGATGNLESTVIPTEFPTANPIAQTDAEVQGNLLREYEQKFAQLPEQEKLTKLCSNAGFSKNIKKGQFFITLDDDTLDSLKGSCREYTLPRSDESSHVRSVQSSRTLRCGNPDRISIS